VFEELDILERTSDPQARDLMGSHSRQIVFSPVIVKDLTFLWMIETADAIQQARFSCTIWSNNGKNFTLINV
jgi:hypothetical protein